MYKAHTGITNTEAFHSVVQKLRSFFITKGFLEVHTQDRLSILAACEDPSTVATFEYAGNRWPLPQTGQMWLEYELLQAPEYTGVFCVSTSYRNEQHPIPGRHKLIFPMFEFESKGTINELLLLEKELLTYVGFSENTFVEKDYDELADHYDVQELTHKEENKMLTDFSPTIFLKHFPVATSPFWNMKKNGVHANKIDVILYGNETIGSAERSTNPDEMREQFHSISSGEYASTLYKLFGKDRVEAELEDFLSLTFFPRFGGGIGISRLMDALEKHTK